MKFKITGVSAEKIDVEYEDGVTAEIPTLYGADKGYYAQEIKDSYVVEQTVSVDDIPYKTGDEGTVGDDIPSEPAINDYKFAREACYPENYDIIYYEYLARGGDSSGLTALDAHIKLVNDGIAADSTKYSLDQIEAKLVEFKKDSAFIQ